MNAALGRSKMTGYLGIDGREGLVNVGKRLVRGVCAFVRCIAENLRGHEPRC